MTAALSPERKRELGVLTDAWAAAMASHDKARRAPHNERAAASQESMAALEAFFNVFTIDDASALLAENEKLAAIVGQTLPASRLSDEEVLAGCRTALRSIGSVYYHVESAAARAKRGGNEKAAEALEHVHGRLFWMDFALGTLDERVTADAASRRPLSGEAQP